MLAACGINPPIKGYVSSGSYNVDREVIAKSKNIEFRGPPTRFRQGTIQKVYRSEPTNTRPQIVGRYNSATECSYMYEIDCVPDSESVISIELNIPPNVEYDLISAEIFEPDQFSEQITESYISFLRKMLGIDNPNVIPFTCLRNGLPINGPFYVSIHIDPKPEVNGYIQLQEDDCYRCDIDPALLITSVSSIYPKRGWFNWLDIEPPPESYMTVPDKFSGVLIKKRNEEEVLPATITVRLEESKDNYVRLFSYNHMFPGQSQILYIPWTELSNIYSGFIKTPEIDFHIYDGERLIKNEYSLVQIKMKYVDDGRIIE